MVSDTFMKFPPDNLVDDLVTEELSASILPEDRASEPGLRPLTLDQYVGQTEVVESLRLFITAAKKRGTALDHVLLHGHPGLGKTTLANIISAELGTGIRCTSGPVIERPGDLAAILTNLQQGEVLFIDEIHRLSPVVEEILYPAMEDFKLDLIIGQGPSARTIKIDIPPFTMVGATTRAGLLSPPLRDRFGVVLRVEFYEDIHLKEIVERSARIMGIHLDSDGAMEIARRSRGTPRIANRLLRRVRDFAEVRADGRITREVADAALNMLHVDTQGLDRMDREILTMIIDRFGGGPVGLDTLATSIGEDSGTIEDVYEPFLILKGYIHRTPRGRIATDLAYRHLGREWKQ